MITCLKRPSDCVFRCSWIVLKACWKFVPNTVFPDFQWPTKQSECHKEQWSPPETCDIRSNQNLSIPSEKVPLTWLGLGWISFFVEERPGEGSLGLRGSIVNTPQKKTNFYSVVIKIHKSRFNRNCKFLVSSTSFRKEMTKFVPQ